MGKALKTAGAIIGGAVLMATGVGALAGVQVTAMGIAGIGTMSVANLQLMSAGLMAAGSMLDKPKSTASGSPSDWTSNPDQGIPFLFGRMGVAGKIVHRDEYGQDNRLQGIVSVYSGAGPVKSFQGFTADELPVSFVSNGGTAVGKYNRQMWRSWRMGAQPDTALSLPTGLDGGAVMPMWGAAYKLSGKACDLLTLQQDSKFSVYPSGEPKPMQVLEGVYGYDPRYDDTYPGGAGPCRYGVRSTYRYIDNAIIAALNWALGMVENGQVVGGIGASLQGVDLPAFVEAANIADANAWTVAAWPDTSEDASVVLDELLEAGGAKRSRVSGKISCVSRGAPRPSIVTITRRDTAGAIELDTGASRFNRLNTITPVIMSEAHKWQHAPMEPVSFAPLVAEDGGKRSDQIKYRFVSKVKQGAELAAYDILDAREPFAGTIPLLPHLRRLKPGDCFDIDEPGFMLDGVKMLVLGRSYDPKAGEVRIAFRSETDSKHPLALGKTTTMPDYPGLTAPDPTEVSPPQPGDWTIIPRPPAPGGQLPVIDLSGIVSNATADAMLINWREVLTGEDPDAQPPFMGEDGELLSGWVDAGVWPPTTRTLSIQGPQPGAQIWIAVRYKRGNNVSPAELAGPITVGDLIAGGLAPDSPDWDTIRDLANGEAAAELIAEAEARQAAALATAKAQLQAADAATNAALSSADTRLTSGLNALSTALDDLALEDLDGFLAFSSSIQTALDGKATNGQLTALATRVTTAEGTLTAQNTRLNTVETNLAGKASATDLTNLATRVTSAEGVNSAQNTRLNTVESDVAGKASAASLSNLEVEVTAARDGAANLKSRLTSDRQAVVDGLAGKASASDLTALTTRVTNAEGVNTAQNTRLNTVETDLAGKASSSSVTALSASVAVRTRVFRQPTAPANPANGYPLVQGDLWIRNGSGGNEEISLWTGSVWAAAHDPRIAATAGQVVTLDAKVTGHQTAISDLQAGKASASDLTALSTRVTTAEGVNTAQNTRLNTVESDLAGKASASSVASLEAAVSNVPRIYWIATEPPGPRRINDIWYKNGDANRPHLWTVNGWIAIDDTRVATLTGQYNTLNATVTGHQTAISDLQTGKASASDLAALTTRVTTAEGVNTAQNTRLNTVETSLDGKASSSSVAALSSEVTAARNGSPTLAAQLTAMRQTVVDGLAGKASTTALTTLSSRVGTAEATLTTVAQTAADASGIAKAIIGFLTDVNGKITGMKSENDGVMSLMEFLADVFRIVSADGSTEFTNGIWYTVSSGVRTSWGKVHGASGHGLVWWTGPNSITRGSESKSNAYVYVSMNTTGGPRFGGSDAPTGGNTIIDGPTIKSKGANILAQISSSSWINLGVANFSGLQGNEIVDLQALLTATSVSSGGVVGLEFRLVHTGTGTVIGTTLQSVSVESSASALQFGLFGANAWSGGQSFRLEGRRASGSASVDLSGSGQFTAYAAASENNPGFMTPAQVAQLSAGGGGGAQLATTAPASVGVNNAVGAGTTAARADHVHAHGNQAGGALHALATTSADGFMSSADKSKLNTYPSSAPAIVGMTASLANTPGNIVVRNTGSGAIEVGGCRSYGGHYYWQQSGNQFIRFTSSDSGFNFSHAAVAPAFTPTSDPDLKENIQAVSDDMAALVQVLSAGQIEYDRTQDGVHALGFSAKALRDLNSLWVVGGEALDPEGAPEDLDGAVVDEDGVTLRRPLAVDPMAMISSLFAALRQNANDTGYAEMRLEQALNRIDALEAEMAALNAAQST